MLLTYFCFAFLLWYCCYTFYVCAYYKPSNTLLLCVSFKEAQRRDANTRTYTVQYLLYSPSYLSFLVLLIGSHGFEFLSGAIPPPHPTPLFFLLSFSFFLFSWAVLEIEPGPSDWLSCPFCERVLLSHQMAQARLDHAILPQLLE